MSDREIIDAKRGIVARKSYGFRDEVVKMLLTSLLNVQMLAMQSMAKHYMMKERLVSKT